MKRLENKQFLRFSLVLASVFFGAFIPEILVTHESLLWVVPYILADVLLMVLAVQLRFPIVGNNERIRNDVEFTPPATTSFPVRDFQKDLKEKDQTIQMMVDVSSNGFWTFDVVTGMVYWSQQAVKLLRADPNDAFDSFDLLKSRVVDSDWVRFKDILNTSLQSGGKFSLELSLLKGSENSRLLISGHVQLNEEGRPIRIIGALKESSDNLAKEKLNYFYVNQDPLTGVYNRKFFLEKLKNDVDLAAQRPDYLFAVALLDIDRFGALNASYSINVGDNVLRVVADRIKTQCRSADTIARIGPDVFAIALRDIQSGGQDSDVKAIVRRIHNAVKQPIMVDGREIYIGVSMAVALNREADCVEDILANATANLREMKKGSNLGGIQFSCGGLREKAMRLYKLEFDIRRAIQAQEFVLFYQPVVNIAEGNRVVSFEALVRWNQAENGFVSPAEFIPIAEETGLIIPLGAQLLEKACIQTKKWVDMGFENIQVAVNFSAKQFALDNMLDDVKQVLLRTKLNPKNLKLEITEYTAVCEAEKTIQIMRALSNMGIQISIDDFGTGYSSLSYLKRFPIHTLKMDKSFMDHVTDDEEDASFARMVIGIARSLNLDLIAEGVETESQLEFLRAEGCELIQGFYFSKPLDTEHALAYMQEHYAPAEKSADSEAVLIR